MSKIEWTNETINPFTGCTKVSEGCLNCYAEKMAKRLQANPLTAKKYVNGFKPTFHSHEMDKVFHWKKPRKIFVCSMGDLFHEDNAFSDILHVFYCMALAKHHTYIVLTKRPQRMIDFFNTVEETGNKQYNPLPNVWIGVTVENQKAADERIPLLLKTPAAIRFISIEPMIGAVDLENIRQYNDKGKHIASFQVLEPIANCDDSNRPALDWVILGGETGHNARPMHPDWVNKIKDVCLKYKTPFFFKSWGQWHAGSYATSYSAIVFNDGSVIPDKPDLSMNFSDDLNINWHKYKPHVMARTGKKISGDLIDGIRYNQFPKLPSTQ